MYNERFGNRITIFARHILLSTRLARLRLVAFCFQLTAVITGLWEGHRVSICNAYMCFCVEETGKCKR